jgi:predicted ATPase/serine phosphatase RsbU (regulator of sigma subunit)/tRNA A-37 threonylcarbamoyl transferase component Bud32
LDLAGYEIGSKIYESHRSRVYRGLRQKDQLPVVLKVLNRDYPRSTELARFRREHQILQELDVPGVIRGYELVPYGNTLVLILEDIGAESLATILNQRGFSVEEAVRVMTAVMKALSGVHGRGVLHKDVNPANLIYNPRTQEVRVIDFGVSTFFATERGQEFDVRRAEGTLLYMAPEQTGRMNRAVDYRSDYYSFGATLYHLVTGQPPFTSADPLELVHCHLARQPPSPRQVRPEVSEGLTAVIAKLMAKDADHRYHTATAVTRDLQACLDELRGGPVVNPEQVGLNDVSSELHLPERLYGRQAEVEALQRALTRAAEGKKSLAVVSGESGIGKSMFVGELDTRVLERRGYFVSGKFDQLSTGEPYTALIGALGDLIWQIMSQSDDEVGRWRDRLQRFLGEQAQVIADVLPELALLVGPQPPAQDLPPQEALHRFHFLFQQMFAACTEMEEPLVLFLDDVQWADSASIDLIERWTSTDEPAHALVVIAFRDQEVAEDHPVSAMLRVLEGRQLAPTRIWLGPLLPRDIAELLADAFACEPTEADALAALLATKTNGNPFFLKQILTALCADGAIEVAPDLGRWTWDLEAVGRATVTDNVVTLLLDKIRTLPPDTVSLMTKAACIGGRFDLAMLAALGNATPAELEAALRPAVRAGLMISQGRIGHFLDGDAEPGSVTCSFCHDRVQQAAYSLLSAADAQLLHKALGLQLLAAHDQNPREESIFAIAGHLQKASPALVDPEEVHRLIKVCVQAARRALSSGAHGAATRFLATALARSDGELWTRDYPLALALYESAAEAALLAGDVAQVRQYVEQINQRAGSPLDQVHANIQLALAYSQAEDLSAAHQIAVRMLKRLGGKYPRRARLFHVLKAYMATKRAWAGRPTEAFADLPRMTDPIALAIMRVHIECSGIFYVVDPFQAVVNACTNTRLTFRFGLGPHSPAALIGWAIALHALGGAVREVWQCGEVALAAGRQVASERDMVFVRFGVPCFTQHWMSKFDSVLPQLEDTVRMALRYGNSEMAKYSAHNAVQLRGIMGQRLQELEDHAAQHVRSLAQLSASSSMELYMRPMRLLAHRLMGRAESSVPGGDPPENDQALIFCHHYHHLVAAVFLRANRAALGHVTAANRYIGGAIGLAIHPQYCFYAALAWAWAAQTGSDGARRKPLRTIRKHLKQLRGWADCAPHNLSHAVAFVEAELALTEGADTEVVLAAYSRAIELAHTNGFLHVEALAHERLAEFWRSQGSLRYAALHAREARHRYELWGADTKVEQISREFPDQNATAPAARVDSGSTRVTSTTGSTTTTSASFDIDAGIKAAQAVADARGNDEVLVRLLEVMLEQAGAERGAFIVAKDQRLFVRAVGSAAAGVAVDGALRPIETADEVPRSLVQYVARVESAVVLADAHSTGRFAADPYVRERAVKSALCLPVRHQGELLGVLYLENNLTTAAFTTGRVQLLSVLAAQAAISIKNAAYVEEVRARAVLEGQLEAAREVQRALLPAVPQIPGLAIASHYQSANRTGGDWFGWHQSPRTGRIFVQIGDVTGHGMPAALITGAVSGAVSSAHSIVDGLPEPLAQDEELALIARVMNRTVLETGARASMLMTMAMISFEPATGRVSYLNAGHEPIYLIRPDGVTAVLRPGTPLGSQDVPSFGTDAFSLQHGDILFLYTDGLVENPRPDGSVLKPRKLSQLLASEHSLPGLKDRLVELCGQPSGPPRDPRDIDDVAFVLLQRPPTVSTSVAAAGSEFTRVADPHHGAASQ